eukprot:scaffold275754_cov15-Tisochrysis_lutea.AAC.1
MSVLTAGGAHLLGGKGTDPQHNRITGRGLQPKCMTSQFKCMTVRLSQTHTRGLLGAPQLSAHPESTIHVADLAAFSPRLNMQQRTPRAALATVMMRSTTQRLHARRCAGNEWHSVTDGFPTS